jgi:dTDP-glucose 4,6-dehydratase
MRLGVVNGHRRHHSQADAWKYAPVLTGTTKFEPRPDVKNIMVTGGAGFM